MERRKILLLIIALFIFLLVASILIFLQFAVENEYFTPIAGKPYNMRMDVDDDKVLFLVDVDICNPNSFNISFTKEMIDGTIKFNGEKIGKVIMKRAVNLSARNMTNITLVAEIENSKVAGCLLSHIKNNEESRIDFIIPVNFTIGGVKFKTRYFNGTSTLNTSILEEVDKEVEKIAFPLLFSVKKSTSLWRVEGEEIKFDTHLDACCFPFIPVLPFNMTLSANNVSIAQMHSLTSYHILHRRNIGMDMETIVIKDNIDDYLSTLSSNPLNRTHLKAEIFFRMFFREFRFVKEWNYEINPTDLMGSMKISMQEQEKKKITNIPEIISGISVMWALFGVFLAGAVRHIKRKERQKLL
ncbi:MAG: LEA type 2 family protein [Thermoplasmata archaeon]|nr:LEA type 2 family protein [Thermoplasmata archaeon]